MSIFDRKKKTKEVAAPKVDKTEETPPKADKATKAKVAPAAQAAVRAISLLASTTIIAPLVTEKTARLTSQNVVVFKIAPKANRVAVRQAVFELYGVRPVKVNIITVPSREVHFGRFRGRSKVGKKALVTLPKGSHIDVFASV